MSAYHRLATSRLVVPDLAGLILSLRATISSDVGIAPITWQTYSVKKADPWTAAEVAAAQTLIDNAPEQTSQLTAQHDIDAWPIELKALALALIDALNVIRAALPSPLPAITPQQAISAVRAKAGTL
jgi:hypothetical protein